MISQDIPWRVRVRILALWLGAIGLAVAILVVRLPISGQVTLREGDVAPVDVTAARQATYVSEVLTRQRQDLAANAIPEVYDPIQTRIGRQQLTLTTRILELIGAVRSDSYADLAAKTSAVRAITAIDLPAEVISRTLTLSGPAWDRVAAEIQAVLERAMRDEIRESSLEAERSKVPARVRLDFSDEDAAVVTAFVQDLLVPNTFFSAEKTEQARQRARERVEPATVNVERNEVILRAGDIVSALDIEALEALGLRQRTGLWEDLIAALGFVLLFGVTYLYYVWRQEPQLWILRSEPYLLTLSLLIFLFFGRLSIPSHTILPYLFPYAALAMLLAVMLNLRMALVTSAMFALTVGWLTGGHVELMAYALCGSLIGALKLRRGERLGSYAWAGGYITLVNLLVVAAFRLPGGQWDVRGLAELSLAAVANGLITMTVTLVGLYLAGAAFGISTPLQLLEISRPTHPLLRQLLLKAPGTYHHTLIVSNMAERAAEAIGADSLLTRVGAYYHDVGKTIRPYFFIENRSEGQDPHARLDPYTSAQIIISHVRDGIDLARKYRLPQRVVEFIPQHQGDLLVTYFYHQAVKQASSPDAVDRALFRYPGPRPQNRETAITMLADGAEAIVRSRHPASIEAMEQTVAESMQTRVSSGQLDECSLTLHDLRLIRQAFVDVLRGLHHPRIDYPSEASATPQPDGPSQAAPSQGSAGRARSAPRPVPAQTAEDSPAARAV
jgi:hypothetical protein